LDVTVQAQVLALLRDLQKRLGMALLLITHDLGIVRKMARRIYVMKAGGIVEEGLTEAIFNDPQHPYTQHLLAAEPKGEPGAFDPGAPVVLKTDDLKVWFPIRTGLLKRTTDHVKAVDGVSLELREGQTVGVVGESGSGKTTLGLALLRLIASKGPIVYMGRRIDSLTSKQMRPLRKQMQIVFQDPYGSLSPRLAVGQIIEEGLIIQQPSLDYDARRERVGAALAEVGLDPDAQDRYPHEFSGGQRQRIAIARAILKDAPILILDEATSALDSESEQEIQAALQNLMADKTVIAIAHRLSTIQNLDRLLVMEEGRIIEDGAHGALLAGGGVYQKLWAMQSGGFLPE
ncbi:MAG: ABC transporter ATP-binding protein, partial [Alphaproteobacteria bacterium]|nr:ABC transporter ATP-binding protein [Alphaproteobacteria bacterium]